MHRQQRVQVMTVAKRRRGHLRYPLGNRDSDDNEEQQTLPRVHNNHPLLRLPVSYLWPEPDEHVFTMATRTTPTLSDKGSTASSLNRGMLCHAPRAPGVGGSPLSIANHELHKNSAGWEVKISQVSSLLTAPPEKTISTSRSTCREVPFSQPEDRDMGSPSTIS